MNEKFNTDNWSYEDLGEIVDTAIRKVKIIGRIEDITFDMTSKKIMISAVDYKSWITKYYEIHLHNILGETFMCHFDERDSVEFSYRRL